MCTPGHMLQSARVVKISQQSSQGRQTNHELLIWAASQRGNKIKICEESRSGQKDCFSTFWILSTGEKGHFVTSTRQTLAPEGNFPKRHGRKTGSGRRRILCKVRTPSVDFSRARTAFIEIVLKRNLTVRKDEGKPPSHKGISVGVHFPHV